MNTCEYMFEQKMLWIEGFISNLPSNDVILWWWFNCQGMA